MGACLTVRILHVVPSYYPAVRYGGPIVSVHGLCKALARRGHDVQVFTTNVDGKAESNVPVGLPVELDGVKVSYFPVPVLRRLYWSPHMGRALQAQVQSFNIMHTHSVFLWPTWAAARAATRHGVPYVVSPRGMLVADLIRRKSRMVKSVWLRLIERSNLEHAAAIHVTSRIEGDDVAKFGMTLPPVHIVPNGVDTTSLDLAGDASSAGVEALTASLRYLLFIGRINWKKGLDRLIPAMARLPEGAREVFVLHDVEGYRHEEIAEMLGLATGTSKSQLHRARMALRQHLGR